MRLERRKAIRNGCAWTPADEAELLNRLRRGSPALSELQALFPNRPLAGLRAKIRRLRIKHNLFGSSYRREKLEFTETIAKSVCPDTVFEAYAGDGHQTFEWIRVARAVYASERNRDKARRFVASAKRHGFVKLKSVRGKWKVFRKGKKRIYFFIGDAIDGAAEVRSRRIKIDLLDLDTCGSTLPVLPTLLLLLRPTDLVITHGEYHSLRFKRDDVLRRLFTHRDITKSALPLDIDGMSVELQKAVKVAALRAHNETNDSFWPTLKMEKWLGSKSSGMLRRHYVIAKPSATADCINELSEARVVA